MVGLLIAIGVLILILPLVFHAGRIQERVWWIKMNIREASSKKEVDKDNWFHE